MTLMHFCSTWCNTEAGTSTLGSGGGQNIATCHLARNHVVGDRSNDAAGSFDVLPDGKTCKAFLPYGCMLNISKQEEDGSCWVRIAEVVEVKSSCPYYYWSESPGNRGGWGQHLPSGVRRSVPPMYIAQASFYCPACCTSPFKCPLPALSGLSYASH